MTVINPNSISGITSITLPSGDGNVLTIHTNDGTERFRIDSSGNVKVGSAATISQDGDVFFTGVCTATTLSGDGSALTGIAATDNVRTGILDVAGIATFRNDVNIGAAVTISESGIEASGIGITCANINGQQIGGRRNLVQNGAMMVAQRSASETGLGGSAGYFTLDRYRTTFSNTAGRLTMAQVAAGVAGFANAMKLTCTTADTSIGSNEYFILQQKFEGQDLQQLKKGSSEAEEFTVSFYVKGNASATYVVEMYDLDNARQVSKTFSVTTSWTRVVLTFPADTTGALDDDNAASLQLGIWLHGGSDYTSGTLSTTWSSVTQANRAAGTSSFFDSTDRTFFLTGLQLEVGSQATPFEHRSYGEELSLCSRYCQVMTSNATSERINFANVVVHGAGSGVYIMVGLLPMRSAPSVTTTGSFNASVITGGWTATAVSSITSEFTTANGNDRGTWGYDGMLSASIADSCTVGLSGQIFSSSGFGQFVFSADL